MRGPSQLRITNLPNAEQNLLPLLLLLLPLPNFISPLFYLTIFSNRAAGLMASRPPTITHRDPSCVTRRKPYEASPFGLTATEPSSVAGALDAQ